MRQGDASVTENDFAAGEELSLKCVRIGPVTGVARQVFPSDQGSVAEVVEVHVGSAKK